jgi:hypothetical protein
MKKILYYILALTVVAGCYKDESSDRYDPIGAIEINGVEEAYNLIMLADALEITPEITSTSPDDKVDGFEYLWTCYNSLEAGSTSAVIDTVAHTKDIAWDITLKPGAYTVMLRVTNPANGYAVYRTTTLNVSTVFSNGFYFLKETAGGDTELDFHKPDGAGGWTTAVDILKAQFGEPITGTPTSLGQLASYPYINKENGQPQSGAVLVPIGGKDLKVLLLEDLSLVYDHNEIFFSGAAPDHTPLRAFYFSFYGIPVFMFDDGAYIAGYGSQTGKVGYPTPEGGCRFSHGVMAATISASAYPILQCFDELNNQFVYYYDSGEQVPLSNATLSPFNITHRPLFMGTNSWCVFKDPATPADRYLYKLNVTNSSVARTPITSIRLISADDSPNFNSADIYGSSKSSANYLYGGKGDKLYFYSTATHAAERLLKDFAGEEITMITQKRGVHNPTDRAVPNNGFLFIATHTGGRYKVYMYNLTTGEPVGDPFVMEGTGKVVDMQYAGGTSAYISYNCANY